METTTPKRLFRLSISNKIYIGFLLIILLLIINSVINVFTGLKIESISKNSADNLQPSKEAVNEMIAMVEQIGLSTTTADSLTMPQVRNFEYTVLKEKLTRLMPLWPDSHKLAMSNCFKKLNDVMVENRAASNAVAKSADTLSFTTNTQKVQTNLALEDILKSLNLISKEQSISAIEASSTVLRFGKNLRYLTVILVLITSFIGLITAYKLAKSITHPIHYMKELIGKLGRGELVKDDKNNFSTDEIGDMAIATGNLINGLKATTTFAEHIGSGKYDADFKPLSEHDVLGNALLNMRGNLARVAEEDKKRNWATEGLAKFAEILRTNNSHIEKLSDEIIANLVKYLKANQGALYIIDDTNLEEPSMVMAACYAWDKKKFLNQQIAKGQGLAGQAWQEMDTIYLTDVPKNYIRITSGLGDANPNSILIVPLKLNEQIFGVVEIASFNTLGNFEIEFVQKISESIASAISAVKVNTRTQKLLAESQQMTEEVRAQEEEMRQNMEELQATQEEMKRQEAEMMKSMEDIMTASQDEAVKMENKYKKVIAELEEKLKM